jgi:hypothetical protein
MPLTFAAVLSMVFQYLPQLIAFGVKVYGSVDDLIKVIRASSAGTEAQREALILVVQASVDAADDRAQASPVP